jgi:S-adenosylmethionine:tRNA ribosyltransferase-isomerase
MAVHFRLPPDLYLPRTAGRASSGGRLAPSPGSTPQPAKPERQSCRSSSIIPGVDTASFDFELPPELIAQHPAPERTSARLLVLDRGRDSLVHRTVRDLPEFLRPGDLLVLNETRVFPARLLGHRVPSGGAVECLLIGHVGSDQWEALVHPGQKLKPGARVVFEGRGRARLHGEILERRFHGRRLIRMWAEDAGDVDQMVDEIGHVPLPPYIHRPDEPADGERYQTVFARRRGSVAAPTAGLHFSESLLADLDRRGVERVHVTLHVGYGTFKPVRVERIEDHVVDPEWFEIEPAAARAIESARADGRRVIAVGTTTTRALESVVEEETGRVEPGARWTSLFIRPGHRFRTVTGLFTNFHLPRSSLLVLVAAFAGRERILDAYREAVGLRYRFYSYGDAMLIL